MGFYEILNRRVPAGLLRRANKHLLLDLTVKKISQYCRYQKMFLKRDMAKFT